LEARFASHARGPAAADGSDAVEWRMRNVPIDRIAHVTMELQQRGDAAVDAVDALAMRLLLNDYTVATTHLRSVARIAAQGLASASSHLEDVRAVVERELQQDEEGDRSNGDF
jgi:hypothetical protein